MRREPCCVDLVNKLRAGDVLTEDEKQRLKSINFISDSYRTAHWRVPAAAIAAACAF